MSVRYRSADDAEWERQKEAVPQRYSFTRDELIEALTSLEAYPATAGPGQRTFVVAESMADALIEALEAGRSETAREGFIPGRYPPRTWAQEAADPEVAERRRHWRASLRDPAVKSAPREGSSGDA